ncbi:MAG: efflux RND transporter periplasmic adaptor subunit [Gammaproteobacteria bacterium]|nr:efflux RND transporter periplasmic adaptor subunit [Gammaproteobacteria bacterium]MBV8306895.1 efflux RND transporter periplasmic adaptor subunit [Gammaproteobacteria bacterium]
MTSETDKKALLGQLRIDRSEPPASAAAGRKRVAIAVAAILVVAVLAIGAWLAFATRAVATVHTAIAQPIGGEGAGGASVLDATGYVTARRQATVSAQITGTVAAVLIEEGDHVREGQVIGRLDDTAQRAALAQAQAQLHSAQALQLQAQAQLAQNQRDVKRDEDLLQRKLISEQAVELARTQVETQTAQVESQRKLVDLAEANVRSAQVQLDYCTVRAPFTGVVIAKAAQVGEIISPLSAGGGFTRTGIGTLVDMDSLEVEVDVNEAYINRVEPGQRVESVLNAYPDWRIPSHVIAIIPTADRSKATVKVRIGLDVKDNRIVPDMGVRVSFLEAAKAAGEAHERVRGALVPAAAVRKEGEQEVVFVLRDHRAERRAVTLGGTSAEARQLLSGVSPGEAVIVDAPAELKDGAAVTEAKP